MKKLPSARPVVLVIGLGLIATAAVHIKTLQAQEQRTTAAAVRNLNNQLLDVYARLLSSPAGQELSVRGQGATIISQRAAALESLIRQNPSHVLSLAFSQDVLSALAKAFPQSASRLESAGTWEGPVEYLIEDGADLKTHRDILLMKAGTEKLDVHFGSGKPPDLKSSDILRIHGVRVGTEVAAADGSVTGTVSGSPAMCTPIGQQRSLVLLLTMPGVVPPSTVTPASVADIFFATSGRSVSEFWRENSYGVTTATGDVLGWYTLDANYTCDQTDQIRAAAIRAVDSIVDFRQYSRIFLIVAGIDGSCGWAGLGTVGCSSLSSAGDGSFTASTSWIVSDYFGSQDPGLRLAVHEGGHNLGLDHASSRDFGTEALGSPGTAGTLDQYGDLFSAMASRNFGHYAAPHKVKLGWIVSDMQTVTDSGSFSVQPSEVGGAIHTLKIRRGIENNNWLWVEYRNPLGMFDTTLASQVFGGGLIHYQDSTTGNYTHLLDFTPETSSWSDPALPVGQTWVDPYTNLSISIDNASSTALGVTVAYGPLPCVQAPPTVSVSPFNPSAYPGNGVSYTVAVTNNDASSCSPRSFDLSSLIPNWATTFSPSSLIVSPSSTALTTMSKLVPLDTAPATYSVDASVVSASSSVDGIANITVMPPPCTPASPTATLSPSNPSAYPGASVPYTVTVVNNDTGSCTPRSFSLSSSMPATWTTIFSQTSLTLPPASTTSATMSEVVPSGTAPATYSVNALVTNGSSSVAATANVTIQVPPLILSLSIPSGMFSRNSNVSITAKVTKASNPASGAYVQFTVVNPNGATTTKKVTTDSTGQAVWSYRVGAKDPKGAYQVTAQAISGSQTAGPVSGSFSVQ